jgi:hypothetical protein
MPDREVVISLKRGVQLAELVEKPGDTLQAVVKGIAGSVRIVDVFSTRRVAIRASEPARSRLENALGDACHFLDRATGHVL